MNDMQRDADRIGKRIWPQPGAVLERVTAGGAAPGAKPGARRGLLMGVATAAALVAVLVTALALRGNGGSTPGAAGAVAPSTSSALPTIASNTSSTTSSSGSATATASTATVGTATVVPPGTPRPSATLPPTPPAGGAVSLTEADAGRTISVRPGTTIVVTLSASGGPYRWTEPDTSNAAAVARTRGAANPDGSASATFSAVGAGSADLTAVDHPSCYPQCLPPDRLWKVTIVVTP